jgi:hypothetical protein
MLSDGEQAALSARLNSKPLKADWALYDRDLATRILSPMSPTVAAG